MDKIEHMRRITLLSTNPTEWPNTLKQFVGSCRQIFLRVFDHFVGLALKGLRPCQTSLIEFSCKKMLTAKSCESFFQQKNRVKNYRSS